MRIISILQKGIQFLLLFLFFILPLLHSRFLESITGVHSSFAVMGNFEFTKSQFFICLIAMIFILFAFHNLLSKKKCSIPVIPSILIPLLIFSTAFSVSPYVSMFGSDKKGHGLILFLSLIGLYFILIQQTKQFQKKLIQASLSSAIIVSLLTIKEYIFPSFQYSDLGPRAIGTFGHPNYLVLFLLIIVPFLITCFQKNIRSALSILLIVTAIFLTKSAWGVSIFLGYFLFIIIQKYKPHKIWIYLSTLLSLCVIAYLIYHFGLYTKLHSFISRFYIWETTLKIIQHQPQILLFGAGPDSLLHYFELYKSPELYLFENFGFSADRPHNLLLNLLFHFGILGCMAYVYTLFYIYTNYKSTPEYHALILFFMFTLFNFASIASYVIIILIFSLIAKPPQTVIQSSQIFSITMILCSCFSLYWSFHYYYSETLSYKGEYRAASQTFPYNPNNYQAFGDQGSLLHYSGYMSRQFFITQFQNDTSITDTCELFTKTRSSAESFLYCGNLLWNYNEREKAKDYYQKGLKKIPDLWNADSPYHTNLLIQHSIDGTRFFSEKYSNISEILTRLKIQNNFPQKN